MDWLTGNKIPIGTWAENFFDFLDANFAWFFDLFSDGLSFMIHGLTDVMLWFHPLALIAILAAIAYLLQRNWKVSLALVASLMLVINLGYWEQTIETFSLTLFATFICMLCGVPLGVAAAHRPWLYAGMRPVLDLMQTIPTFVYLIPTLILFGLGVVPGLTSTVVFAIPAPIRLTYLGIFSVPKQLVEAGESFGATKRQLLWKVELPHALPTIMAGLTQCIMLSLSMVVIAALVGADGLGKPVVRALNTVNVANGVEAGIAIVIMAILLDRVCKRKDAAGKED